MPAFSIALPTGLLFSSLKERVEKWLLFDTYVASQQEYLNHSAFLRLWTSIGHGLEMSAELVSVLSNDKAPTVQIALRCTDPTRSVQHVTLVVEAESKWGTFQDSATFRRIGSTPVIAALRSIPLRACDVSTSGQYVASFDRLQVYLLDVSCCAVDSSLPVWTAHPNNGDLLNDRFVERWGIYWNMAAIDFAVREQGLWLYWLLVSPRRIRPSGFGVPWREMLGGNARSLLGRPVCWLLSRDALLRLYFWLPIWLGRKQFVIQNGSAVAVRRMSVDVLGKEDRPDRPNLLKKEGAEQ